MRIAFVALLGALSLACPSQVTTDYDKYKIDATEAIKAATLGIGDVFEVRVHHHNDMSGTFRVGPEGEINFPFVGRISVAGFTASAVGQVVQDKLKDGYLKNPFVTVFIKEFNSKKVFVLGQVQKPGIFAFEDGLTVVQAIAIAGGFTSLADKNFAIVKRTEGGVDRRIPVPVERIVSEGGARDFRLKPGDVVFVPESYL